MNNRIRELRKELGLNQTDFGKRIGIKQTTVAGYETGAKNPMDAVITSICREFNVSEVWLRTGEGGMFSKINADDRYSLNLGKLSKEQNQLVRNAVNYLAESEPEKLNVIAEFMKACLGIE